MKISAVTSLFLASTAMAASDQQLCGAKHPHVVDAIIKFCSKTDLVVPSSYAKKGARTSNNFFTVNIEGNCKPAQWVPQHYCLSQFFHMCQRQVSKLDNYAGAYATFGSNNGHCQEWNIQPGIILP